MSYKFGFVVKQYVNIIEANIFSMQTGKENFLMQYLMSTILRSFKYSDSKSVLYIHTVRPTRV
jgi:hypothetical protein